MAITECGALLQGCGLWGFVWLVLFVNESEHTYCGNDLEVGLELRCGPDRVVGAICCNLLGRN